MSTPGIALAVDGGGTKTVACLAGGPSESDSQLLACGTSGSSNPAAVGVKSAWQMLRTATQQALHTAGVLGSSVRTAIVGLAGLEASNCGDDLRTWMTVAFGIPDVRVVTDVELLLFAGQRQLPAIVLISGTGSTAFGRREDQTARTGGRGYLLGDEGSGFWIGQRGMIAALRAMDQAAPETSLVQHIGERLAAETPEQWTERVYAVEDPRQLIAQMSRQVVDAASEGDKVANSILEAAAHELSIMVVSVARQLDVSAEQYDLVLTGGILTQVQLVRDRLLAHLQQALSPRELRVIPVPAEAAARRALAAVG